MVVIPVEQIIVKLNQRIWRLVTLNNPVKNNQLLIIFLFFILSIQIFNITVYSQEIIDNIEEKEKQQDILTILSNSSITNILITTFTIPIIGLLIAKLKGFHKKLEMIEVLTKVMVKMKTQNTEREKRFEERFIKTQEDFTKQVKGLCEKFDTNTKQINEKLDNNTRQINHNVEKKHEELEGKIKEVESKATNVLIEYLSGNVGGSSPTRTNNSSRKNKKNI